MPEGLYQEASCRTLPQSPREGPIPPPHAGIEPGLPFCLTRVSLILAKETLVPLNRERVRHDELLEQLYARLVIINSAICSLERAQLLGAKRPPLTLFKRILKQRTA